MKVIVGCVLGEQSAALEELLRSRAEKHLKTVRCDKSLSQIVDASHAGQQVEASRQAANQVVQRKDTEEIIEEEKAKIEVLAQQLQDTVDENGVPRLLEECVQEFKTLQALSTLRLTKAMARKATTQLALKRWNVTDAEMASGLRRLRDVDPSQMPSSSMPRVRPLSESEGDDDSFDSDDVEQMFPSDDSRTQALRDISNTNTMSM